MSIRPNGFESAALRMQKLGAGELTQELIGANEAATRLLLIDEVLRILGWPKSLFHVEQAIGDTSFLDYLLTAEGKPRLIVEAKKWKHIDPFPQSIRQKQIKNGVLFKSCGQETKLLLEQCQRYCVKKGVPYALATTGEVWIVLMGFKDGADWDKLPAFIFHSLEDVCARFKEFYGLISYEPPMAPRGRCHLRR